MLALDALRASFERLNTLGIPDAEKEAELLITSGLGIERVTLYRDNPGLSEKNSQKLEQMLARRQRREPIQYILGEVEFYGLRIRVGPGVLIPRPETELLVEEVLRRLSARPAPRVLELCAGSGCVALAVARALPGSSVLATEISVDALRRAEGNAALNKISNVTFLQGSLFEPVEGEKFDAVLSNPPYVKTGELEGLAPEISDWEPLTALDGGEDGLHFYRELIPQAGEYLSPGGVLIVEMGAALATGVAEIAEEAGLRPLEPLRDWGGCDRVMTIYAG